ncbi:MAG: hypothetical protein C4527_23580 [Candidatus Omnitrophota bacterium]|jgi:hypothetical protein|nr:MAG: hypothetical protein C4527_23580 [Candidatus Omnitrophota bacterium]
MKTIRFLSMVVLLVVGVTIPANAQPAESPEAAGVKPLSGDLSPWRAFGYDGIDFDQVWVIALNNGTIAAFKRAMSPTVPGTIGGSEFLLFAPDGSLLTAAPIPGSFEADGSPTPLVDYASTGLSWGGFTLGAHADRANGNGFVVHNLGENARRFGLNHADEVGDEAFSLVQLFNNDGTPIGSSINAFGALTGESGGYRDIGAAILSNGDVVAIGENRQQSDDLLDAVGAFATEVVIAVILGRDGSTKVAPFVVHTDENGQYLGQSSSAIYQNVVAFEGGFAIDYSQGIRWYNNDGTPRTPVQSDHAELAGMEVIPDVAGFTLGADSGGRGDSMAWASNGKDLLVKSINVQSGPDSVGVLIYYKPDGTVRNFVRFDDTDITRDVAMVDRTFCDMDENGNVFVVWQDKRFGGDRDSGHKQIFGRFFNAEGVPAGPSFPVYENWRSEPDTVNYGGSIGVIPAGDLEQPRCAMNSQIAAVIEATNILPDFPDAVKQLSSAFGMTLGEAVLRLFENPFYDETLVKEWSIY